MCRQFCRLLIHNRAFRYLQQRGHHRLPYQQYLRAAELGVALPEAEPTYRVGLLRSDPPESVEVVMPDRFPLARCYRFDTSGKGDESDEPNVHLLAALGKFEPPFIPVEIEHRYDGYSWADLPKIGKVEVIAGKVLYESSLWTGTLICVECLMVTAQTSDGRVFSSPVCLAIPPADSEENRWEERVLVTPHARARLSDAEIWHHFGGWSDEGDTYDTQESQFSEELDRFWDQLMGPTEHLRRRIFEVIADLEHWQRITLTPDERMVIKLDNGSESVIKPPPAHTPETT